MSQRVTWWLSGGAALVVLALVVGLLTWRYEKEVASISKGMPPNSGASQIGLSRLEPVSAGDLVAEEALFFDPSPLFLPTEWNSDQNALPANVLRDPGQMFQDFEARLVFRSDSVTLKLPDMGVALQKPTDVVSSLEDVAKLSGLGVRDASVVPLSKRSGYVEVVSASTGRPVLQEELGLDGLEAGLWRPLELAGVITARGVVGQFTVVGSTGRGDLDQRIRDHVLKSLHLGERLPPGFYRIFVGS